MLPTRLTIIAFLAAAWCWTSDAKLYHDVACPGQNNVLKCPEGQWIKLVEIYHGEKTDSTCSDRSKRAIIPPKDQEEHEEETCLYADANGWAGFICDNMNRCRLSKPDKRMFRCNFTENTFIQVDYLCKTPPAGLRTAVVCEGQDVKMKCESGSINIVKAKYGRFDEKTCLDPDPKTKKKTNLSSVMTFCGSYGSRIAMIKRCAGKKECKFNVGSGTLGEPFACDTHDKYLTLAYTCQ